MNIFKNNNFLIKRYKNISDIPKIIRINLLSDY